MRNLNRAITIGITCIATPLLSSMLLSLILGGGMSGELILPVFIVGFPFVLCLGTPFSLTVNHFLKLKGLAWFFIKLLVHGTGGLFIIFAWTLLFGGFKEVFSGESAIFYIAGLLHAIVYFVIFSLLKLTGKTDLD